MEEGREEREGGMRKKRKIGREREGGEGGEEGERVTEDSML